MEHDPRAALSHDRDTLLTGLCALYAVAAFGILPPGATVPYGPLAALVTAPLFALGVALLDGRQALPFMATVRACWPVFAATPVYFSEVAVLQLDRGRYIDARLARADEWLGLYRDGEPVWPTGGLLEELANAWYATYLAVPFIVLWVAWRYGPTEATRASTALVFASCLCGFVWLALPAGGYFEGGSPQDGAFGPFSALIHGTYARFPHFAGAFPSEHVALTVALTSVLGRQRGAWVWLWPLGIALSTVLGRYHFATDALAGWAVGLAAAAQVHAADQVRHPPTLLRTPRSDGAR